MTDGGLNEVWSVCPDASDAGSVYELDGGAWVLPYPHGPRLACMLSGCEAYARRSEQPVPTFSEPAITLMLVLAVLGAVMGLVGGWMLSRELK